MRLVLCRFVFGLSLTTFHRGRPLLPRHRPSRLDRRSPLPHLHPHRIRLSRHRPHHHLLRQSLPHPKLN